VIASKGIESASQVISLVEGRASVTLVMRSEPKTGDSSTGVSSAQLMVPSKARHELDKAEDAVRKKKWGDAFRSIEKALTIWPRYAEALILRALIERNQHSPGLALTDAEKAIDYDPNYGKAYLVLGCVYNDLNRFDDAISTLDHGITIAPDNWQGYYEMGRAMLSKGNFDGALRQVDKGSALAHSDYPPIHLVKGFAYLGLKNQSAALVELEAYLKLAPNTETASHVKQVLNQLTGDKQPTSDSQQTTNWR